MLDAIKKLGLDDSASWDDIKLAYRDMVRVYHPDHIDPSEVKLRLKCQEKTKDLNAAYSILKNFLAEVDGVNGRIDPKAPFLVQYCYKRAYLRDSANG